MLKVGELAKRTGLTVRTLHHYDSIGLLQPSARSDSGYRLYQRDDIARLHQIQALRRFGMSLADIGDLLANKGTSFAVIVDEQIAALGRQIEQANALRNQLMQLQRQLDKGDQPELADWLTTLELMTMYDQYFSKEELSRLPFAQPDTKRQQEWDTLVLQMRALMEGRTPANSVEARHLSHQWMVMLERDTSENPDFAARLNAMLTADPAVRERSGITLDLREYVQQAFSAFRLSLYAKYLDADELAHMRDNSGKHTQEWAELVADVHRQMHLASAPESPAVQALARQWFALFQSFAGPNSTTREKIRHAHEQESALLTGTWMNDDMLAFLRQSLASLQAN
ncbi:MAG: MerR family transcriptional regulator [Paludibacterium sp.]|uniref:MerR family transcriptional regulator n=1 Tax=Paludibacterium sp. TaxID=1917523 RepID=UPI0026006271|nr:MerR family transcriptional regulator [Paludibacterium sp.]MBV8045707.1 MerR family transcriptional regulator [Paludibacterium sp.]